MFADKVLQFLLELEFSDPLPEGISIMNPYRGNPGIIPVVSQFYHKFYDDDNPRHLILGINPGRYGAGVTGIPFTDSKRLEEKCGLSIPGLKTFETSSVFVYKMIDAFGGPGKFYNTFFISAVCPLGFTAIGKRGKNVNFNYYDKGNLLETMQVFILESLKTQIDMGVERDYCFCLGTGKNYGFLMKLNERYNFFGEIVALEHPRFIMQYKLKKKHIYISKYIEELKKVLKDRFRDRPSFIS